MRSSSERGARSSGLITRGVAERRAQVKKCERLTIFAGRADNVSHPAAPSPGSLSPYTALRDARELAQAGAQRDVRQAVRGSRDPRAGLMCVCVFAAVGLGVGAVAEGVGKELFIAITKGADTSKGRDEEAPVRLGVRH